MSLKNNSQSGFSLVEIIIVISCLGILITMTKPIWSCFPKKTISKLVQQSILKIKEECELNSILYKEAFFNPRKVKNYNIISNSNGDSSCNGIISAIPERIDIYPSYFYDFETKELSYEFKGQTGTDISDCDELICARNKGDAEECKYRKIGNVHESKWWYAQCLEKKAGYPLCEVSGRLTPPFTFIRCP